MQQRLPARRASLIACAALLAGASPVGLAQASGRTLLAHVATRATDDERRSDQVWLAYRERAAERFVAAASTPGSGGYRRFLSPGAYTNRFAASAAQVTAVESYLKRAGFGQVRASADDEYVSAIPPARLRGNLIIPRSIRRDVLAVTGPNGQGARADDAVTSTTGDAAEGTRFAGGPGSKTDCSRWWGQRTETFTPAYDGLTEAAIPVCGYSAEQMRAAYRLSPADTGAGTTVALIEVGAPDEMLRTLNDWARASGLPAPSNGQYRERSVDGGAKDAACVDESVEEAAIDSEATYAMAPRARQLMVDGDDCDPYQQGMQALYDAMLVPLTGHGPTAEATVENVCFGTDTLEARTSRNILVIGNAIALRAAAEGVSLVVASGDTPGVDPPASNPYLTAVGGTTLGIGAANQRLFETGWSTDFGERTGTAGAWTDGGIAGAAGGGVSGFFAEPSYQQHVVPRPMARADEHSGRVVPDIAADADPYSGMLFGVIYTNPKTGRALPYQTIRNAGTSMAAPLIAGIIADGDQGQIRRFGFLNPLLYRLAGTAAFYDTQPVMSSDPAVDRAFLAAGETEIHGKFARGYLVGINDAQNQRGTNQVTAPGYDTMTGLGSPNGTALIQDLRAGG